MGAFFIALFFLPLAAAGYCPTPTGLTPVVVKRVVDGDTLHLRDGRKVRFIGINTPELGRSPQPFALAAQQRLAAWVKASDQRVMLEMGRKPRDSYGRTLAHVYDVNGANLEAQLLAEGLGFAVAVAPDLKLRDCHQAAERAARSAGLGVWGRSPVQASRTLRSGGFAVVSGRAGKVSRNRGGVWINMPGSLVLRVKADQLKYFSTMNLMSLEGRHIEVRGWVVDRSASSGRPGESRWLLPLTDSGMLELNPPVPAS